jgi:hypothetical protein
MASISFVIVEYKSLRIKSGFASVRVFNSTAKLIFSLSLHKIEEVPGSEPKWVQVFSRKYICDSEAADIRSGFELFLSILTINLARSVDVAIHPPWESIRGIFILYGYSSG